MAETVPSHSTEEEMAKAKQYRLDLPPVVRPAPRPVEPSTKPVVYIRSFDNDPEDRPRRKRKFDNGSPTT